MESRSQLAGAASPVRATAPAGTRVQPPAERFVRARRRLFPPAENAGALTIPHRLRLDWYSCPFLTQCCIICTIIYGCFLMISTNFPRIFSYSINARPAMQNLHPPGRAPLLRHFYSSGSLIFSSCFFVFYLILFEIFTFSC